MSELPRSGKESSREFSGCFFFLAHIRFRHCDSVCFLLPAGITSLVYSYPAWTDQAVLSSAVNYGKFGKYFVF